MITPTANWKAACPQNVDASQSLVHIMTIAGNPIGPLAYRSPGSDPTFGAPYIISLGGGGMESDGLECTATNGTMSIETLDYNFIVTNAIQAGTLEGLQVTITSGFKGLASADFIPYGTYIIDSIEPLKANIAYRFNLRDLGLLMEQTIWPYGDNSDFPVSSDNPLTVVGDPMSILTEILETECGYPSGNVNAAVIAAYQAGLFNGCEMQFSVTQSPQAKAWVNQEIFNPLSGFGFWNSAGQYTPKFLLPQGPPSVASYPVFTTKSILDPIPTPSAGPYCAALLMMMDYDGSNYKSQILTTDAAGLALYDGVMQVTNRQSDGLRSANGGSLYAQLAASATFRRYANKPWVLNFKSPWPAILLEVGDVVPVTHPQIPLKGEGMGFTNRWFEVQKKEPDWSNGTVDLSLIDVNWQNQTQRVIAPDGTPNYAGSTPTQQGEYLYPDQGQVIYA